MQRSKGHPPIPPSIQTVEFGLLLADAEPLSYLTNRPEGRVHVERAVRCSLIVADHVLRVSCENRPEFLLPGDTSNLTQNQLVSGLPDCPDTGRFPWRRSD